MLSADPMPRITAMFPSPEEEAGALLNVDLDEVLALYVRERAPRRAVATAFRSRLATDGGARSAQSILGLDHISATVTARDAARLPN